LTETERSSFPIQQTDRGDGIESGFGNSQGKS
jgi:hypothetical protein